MAARKRKAKRTMRKKTKARSKKGVVSKLRTAAALQREAEIEYGMKEFLQGVLIGFIIGFLIATQLL